MPLTTLAKNLNLGHSIVRDIKSKVTCSHDIIRREEMPLLTNASINAMKQRFGTQKVDDYLEHLRALKLIRSTMLGAFRANLNSQENTCVSLAITRKGAGECEELATLTLFHLALQKRYDTAFITIASPPLVYLEHPEPYGHCFVLLGYEHSYNLSRQSLNKLTSLPAHVVAIDPYLNYVGSACNYIQDNKAYLETFRYYRICEADIDTMRQDKMNTTIKNLKTLLELPTVRSLRAYSRPHFDRDIILSANCEFNLQSLEVCHETALVELLNEHSGLQFSWGHMKQKVHAYSELKNHLEVEKAHQIQGILRSGNFYKFSDKYYYTLHEINNPETGLPQRIHGQYTK